MINHEMTYKKFLIILLRLVKIVTLGLTLLIFLFLFNKYYVPFGKLELIYDFSQDSRFISKLTPWQRLSGIVELNGDFQQEIQDDLVYFDVKIPRPFASITPQITFNNNDFPLFIVGARLKGVTESYAEKPLKNNFIDESLWNKIREGDLMLLQKVKKFNSVNDFLAGFTRDERAGTFFYSLKQDRIITDYQKSDKKTTIDHALRDRHTLFTYIKDEDLDFVFYKQDLNRYAGQDELKIEVFNQYSGQREFSQTMIDDGETGITGKLGEEQTLEIKIPNLPEGVYRLELIGERDVLIKKIITSQHLLVFSSQIFPVDNEEYFSGFAAGSRPTTVFTNAGNIQFKTSHPSGLQQLTIGNQIIDLNTVDKTFLVSDLSGITKLTIPKNDVFIESDGLYAFSEDQYFFPYPENIIALRHNTDIDSLDYIISSYTPPEQENGWSVKSNSFNLSDLQQDENGRIRFRFSAPGLKEFGQKIDITEIRVILEKPPITIKNFPSRLKGFIQRQFRI